jgi:5-(carboxyamino)imidazole ribonucleotide synthase
VNDRDRGGAAGKQHGEDRHESSHRDEDSERIADCESRIADYEVLRTVEADRSTDSESDIIPVMIRPGSTIGIFGSGQLGRMIANAARPLGYRVHVFGPDPDSPAGQVADRDTVASYDDRAAVEAFASACDVLTIEFENIPVQTIEWAEAIAPVRPSSRVLHVTQHRVREKTLCVDLEIRVPPFAQVASLDELRDAVRHIGTPAVLKTTRLGYDGKGQARIQDTDAVEAAWETIGRSEAILEGFVDFRKEISVVSARSLDGSFAHWGVMENVHTNHILDTTITPAAIDDQVHDHAVEIARQIANELEHVGVICVEMFLDGDDRLLVNEMAPRVHNSGHLTIEASDTSQFEQHVRAICGLPLGSTATRPAAMANLLGDMWGEDEPHWVAALETGAKIHLYGKTVARPGRKMGHLTAVAASASGALAIVRGARDAAGR